MDETESNIRSLDYFRRRRDAARSLRKLDALTAKDLAIEVGRLEDVARFLLRRDDHWGAVVAQLQRDVSYLLQRERDALREDA